MSKGQVAEGSVSFRALKLVNEHRSAYGLRYNDYKRYRDHCKNRIHRLRSSLKATHGKGREYKKVPAVTPENAKEGHLQLLLFEAERAWAYSQELHTKSLEAANKDSPTGSKLRHKATNRFRRVLHWTAELFSLVQGLHVSNRLNASDMLELCSYTCMMSGRFLRYREDFEESLNMLSVSYSILSHLADSATNSRDQALATFFSDSIAPEIRYCAHQLGYENAHDVDRIAGEVSKKQAETLVQGYDNLLKRSKEEGGESAAASRGRLRDMEWENEKVTVRIPELVDVLLEVQNAEERLKGEEASRGSNDGSGTRQRKGVAAFDAILAALSDAEDVARRLVEAQKSTSSSITAKVGERDLHFVHAFIVYQLLSRRIERDLTLISALIDSSEGTHIRRGKPVTKSKKNGSSDARVNPAVVKLLDTVLQSLTHMRSLSIVDESPDVANGIELRIAFTKAKRCLYLGRSYAVVKQYAKAILLLRRGTTYVRESESFRNPTDTDSPHLTFFPLSFDAFSALSESLDADENSFKQDWFVFNGGQVSAERDTSKKPLHFDIALNYVQLDLPALYKRAGLEMPEGAQMQGVAAEGVVSEKAKTQSGKAKEDMQERPETPEPSGAARASGLGALLGNWWGRK